MEWMRRSVGASGRATFGCALVVLAASPAVAGPVRFAGEGHAETPVWSLDGSHLVFEVNRLAGDIEMFMTKVKGDVAADATPLKLPGSSGPYGGGSASVVVNATWHPQGVVVLEASNQGGDYRLYFGQTTGGGLQQYIQSNELSGKLTFPTVSADGSQMAFVASATGNGDVYSQNSADRKITQLTNTSATESFPQFSRDGKRLLFTRKQNGSEDVFELVLGSDTVNNVVGGSGDQSRPVYADGGAVVYFDGARGEGLWDLAMVPAAGGKPATLARDVRLPTRARPAVSPDGKWVAYAHSDPTRDDVIYLSSLDGNTVKEIKTGMKACGDPAITVKDGRTILAYTALPADQANWRSLVVTDITDKL